MIEGDWTPERLERVTLLEAQQPRNGNRVKVDS